LEFEFGNYTHRNHWKYEKQPKMGQERIIVHSLAFRLIVSVVLLYAAIPKILNPLYFSLQIEAYEIVGAGVSRVIAIILPWIELIAGLCLLSGFWLRASAFLASVLFSIFMVAIAQALIRGLNIECGCFGPLGKESVSLDLLAHDIFFMLLSTAILLHKERQNLSP